MVEAGWDLTSQRKCGLPFALAMHEGRSSDHRGAVFPLVELNGETERVYIGPDGALNLVPFSALIDEHGRYLVERYRFTYLASGRDLLRFGHSSMARGGPVVMSAPAYEEALPRGDSNDSESAAHRFGGIDAVKFRPLPFAAIEGELVAKLLPSSKWLTREQASKRAVMALAAPSVLHIATHGFFLPASADGEQIGAGALLRAGIALAGANDQQRRHQGIVTALEISQLDLVGTKLVVLSACDTGIGEIQPGDCVYGLRRAITIAGAETQLMSLWSVDDAATCELMEMYYRKLLSGVGRSDALHQTQLEMLQRPNRVHPFYWASFIVSGNDGPLDWSMC